MYTSVLSLCVFQLSLCDNTLVLSPLGVFAVKRMRYMYFPCLCFAVGDLSQVFVLVSKTVTYEYNDLYFLHK